MSDVTEILCAIEQGDPQAANQLLPLVYDELRKLAAAKLSREKSGQTIQPTALVHEAFLRLVDGERVQLWDSRGHFFAAAAEAMRRILIENARRKKSARNGGDLAKHSLTDRDVAEEAEDDRLLALDEALIELTREMPMIGRLVELRYFGGLTIDQAATALKISPRSANRYWTYAKAWLGHKIG